MRASKTSNPIISIVIVTFNAEMYLPMTLESLAKQPQISSDEVEVVLVDGASKDGTLSVADGFGFIDTTVSEPDAGIYDAMNKGVLLAKGRWVQFLNAGDTLKDSLSLGRILSATDVAVAAGTPWIVVGAQNMGGSSGSVRRIRNVPHIWWKHAYGLQPHCHQACIFDRETLTSAGLHSMDFGTAGDFDLILRFGMLSQPFQERELCVNYAGGGVSERTAKRTPSLQHAIRAHRFQLGPMGAAIDAGAGRMVAGVNATRKLGGKAKGALRSALARS